MNQEFQSAQLINTRGDRWACYAEPEVVLNSTHLQGTVFFGFASYMNGGLVRGYVEVGRYCSIGRDVTLGLGVHDHTRTSTSPFFSFPPSNPDKAFVSNNPRRRTIIGNDVWIGDSAKISSGIVIGHGAVIGTGAVVTKDVAPYTIVGGIPATEIRPRFEKEISDALLKSEWWRYEPHILKETMTADPAVAIDALKELPATYYPPRHVVYTPHAQPPDSPSPISNVLKAAQKRVRSLMRDASRWARTSHWFS